MSMQQVTHYTLEEGGPWIPCPYPYYVNTNNDISGSSLLVFTIPNAKAIKTEDNSIYDCILKDGEII